MNSQPPAAQFAAVISPLCACTISWHRLSPEPAAGFLMTSSTKETIKDEGKIAGRNTWSAISDSYNRELSFRSHLDLDTIVPGQ